MTSLGKLITAAGGAIVAVFALVGLIVMAAADTHYGVGGMTLGVFVTTGLKVIAVIEGILLVLIGGAVAASGFVPLIRDCPCGSKSPWALIALVVVTVLPFKLFMMIGALAAVGGMIWQAGECAKAAPVAPAMSAEAPPESKL